jgi:hypothetical protein
MRIPWFMREAKGLDPSLKYFLKKRWKHSKNSSVASYILHRWQMSMAFTLPGKIPDVYLQDLGQISACEVLRSTWLTSYDIEGTHG